ncbi:histidine kinase dimerization/phospho-acceptor domain-containing protein [Algoriphagus boritolerans]|uniref:histidine kinase dimerization/phospho-acceptor domain-containing protein n=1 Tax=Algoriphagus boritolerans TaxID=308111 RepID=UPI000AAC8FB1
MTHEFKTPLATVSLAVEALQDPELSTQDKFRTRYLGIIKDENKRLVSQVEKVLQAAALDKKDFQLKIETIDMSELLESNVDISVCRWRSGEAKSILSTSSEIPRSKGCISPHPHLQQPPGQC